MDKILFYLSALYIGLIPLEAITAMDNVSYGRLIFIPLIILSFFDIKRSYSIKGMRHIRVLILFILWASFSMLWSINTNRTVYTVILLLQYLAITIIATNHANTWSRLRTYMFTYILGCLYIGFDSAFNYNPYDYFRYEEAGNPNENAFMINYSIIFLLLIVLKDDFKRVYKIGLYSLIGIFFFFIFITGSRNGIIMLCIITASYLLTTLFSRLSFLKIVSIFIMTGALYYIYSELPSELIERYLGIADNIRNNQMAGRGFIWDKTISYLENNPFVIVSGVGWGTFVEFFKGLTGIERGAHNFYLNALCTVGIIGLSLILYYLYVLFRYLKNTYFLSGRSNLLIYLLLLIPMVSMMTTNWEGRKWWFVISIFIYQMYRQFPKKQI